MAMSNEDMAIAACHSVTAEQQASCIANQLFFTEVFQLGVTTLTYGFFFVFAVFICSEIWKGIVLIRSEKDEDCD